MKYDTKYEGVENSYIENLHTKYRQKSPKD